MPRFFFHFVFIGTEGSESCLNCSSLKQPYSKANFHRTNNQPWVGTNSTLPASVLLVARLSYRFYVSQEKKIVFKKLQIQAFPVAQNDA